MQGMAEKIYRLFNHRKFNLIAFSLIAALVLVAYSNTFKASFHFDDNPAIVDNYSIKVATWDNFYALLVSIRPVVYLSLMLNYSLGGMNVTGYHVFNVGLHIANSMFVYLLLLWTLNQPLPEM